MERNGAKEICMRGPILVRAGQGCHRWNIHICMGRLCGTFLSKLRTTKLHFLNETLLLHKRVLGMSHHGVVQCSDSFFAFGLSCSDCVYIINTIWEGCIWYGWYNGWIQGLHKVHINGRFMGLFTPSIWGYMGPDLSKAANTHATSRAAKRPGYYGYIRVKKLRTSVFFA